MDTTVQGILDRMTLREKVGQLNQRLLGWTAWERTATGGVTTTKALDSEIARWDGVGAVYGLLRADAWSGRDWSNGAGPELSREVTARVQERITAGSRLGIPALFVEEAPHGHQALGAQLFGTNLGAAAAWDFDRIEEAAAHTATELRARGVHVALVSGLDMLRDPRWGRSEECFGEDPLLAALGTRALVRGMQGAGIAVVLKHFAGQGAAIGGRNASGTPIGPRELAEIHLPAARAGVDEGAWGVMAAYNDLDGVPCTANEELLTGILRDEWGFGGIVMADMFAIDRLMRATPSAAAAAAVALRAGVDLSMCDEAYTAIEAAVEAGLIEESLVDRACLRILTLKQCLGLLDALLPPPAIHERLRSTAVGEEPPAPFPAPAAIDGLTGMVLLHNTLLPLEPVGRLAVVGPNADSLDSLLGDYVPPLRDGVGGTVLDGLRHYVPEARHEPGCGLTEAIDGGLDRAAALAAGSDLVVLVLGSSSGRGYDDDFQANGAARLGGARPAATTGEGFDAAEVRLPRAQLDLVAAVAATGTPTVAVIVSGRPHGVGEVVAACGAVLYAWYPGPDGGREIADVILGGREPGGRLPVSLPSGSAVLPVAYNERLESTLRYVDAPAVAEFPFGAGLGYTTWEMTPPELEGAFPRTRMGSLIRNTGPRRGTQIVQLYGRVLVPGVLPRRAVLAGFTRVTLDPGEARQVWVAVEPDALPGLGIPPGATGELLLWLSITGAGEPADPIGTAVSGQSVVDGQNRPNVEGCAGSSPS